MNPQISILLPSVRPELCAKTISNFEETNNNFDYEITVVSPFEVRANKVRWIKEESKLGSVLATKIAYTYSTAPYVIYFSDDVIPTKDCLSSLYDLVKGKKDPFIGAFKMETPSGQQIGPFGVYGKLYACYGCLSKLTAEWIGGFFDTKFMYSWVDCDLSLRCWEFGGKVEICKNAVVIPNQIEDEIYLSHRETFFQDFDTFTKKWHETLGKDLPRIHGEINKKLK
jgi:GT2 family glycosyltransferase